MRTRVLREGARVRALIGEGDGKVGRKEKESGGGSEEGGVIVGRKGNPWKYEGGEDGGEREARNEKAFTLCEKRRAEGKVGKISRKIVRSRTQNEARREKSGLHRAKNESVPSKKCRKLSLKRRKARKTDILGRKRWGGVAAKKWALLPILQRYEVAKWVQMKFSRIFFR